MPMTREELKRIFQESVAKEFADIPENEDEIEHVFSDKFVRNMDKLIARQKKPYWKLIYNGKLRVAMVAMVCLVLAMTAGGAVVEAGQTTEIVQTESLIEGIRVYRVIGDTTTDLKHKYYLTNVPEGFKEVNAAGFGYGWNMVKYQDAKGNYIRFAQHPTQGIQFHLENEILKEYSVEIRGIEVKFFEYSDEIIAIWLDDESAMIIEYYGCTDRDVIIELIEAMEFEEVVPLPWCNLFNW